MQKLKLLKWIMAQIRHYRKLFFLAFAIGFFFIYALEITAKSNASNVPKIQTATFDPSKMENEAVKLLCNSKMENGAVKVLCNAFKGSVYIYPSGKKFTETPIQHPALEVQDQLWVAGNSKSWAHFRFWKEKPHRSGKMSPLVQAGPADTNTRYTFPCRHEVGSGVIGWEKVNNSACERITIKKTNTNNDNWKSRERGGYFSQKSDPKTNPIANSELTADEVNVSPSKDITFIYINNLNSELAIDVFSGEVTISSISQTVVVEAGKRLIYPGDGSQLVKTDIPADVPNSSPIQTFLEPANWSPDATPLLEKFRSSLQQTPSVSLSFTAQALLDAHNKCRAKAKVQPLRWSNELANYAQDWANQLSQSSRFEHRPEPNPYGENLAGNRSPDEAVNMWCSEEEKYDYTTNTCRGGSMSCYHYTQVVWRKTEEIGCGIAPSQDWGKIFVCNYNPPGNYNGQRPY